MSGSVQKAPYAPVWQEIRAHLEALRLSVMREIRSYPQPIAGCDAQIPVLWEQRDAISAEIARLDAAMREPSPNAVEAFIATSPVLDEAYRQQFRDAAKPLKSAAE